MAAQLACAERAVEPDRQRPGVGDRGVERLDRLARQGPPGRVGDRPGDHQRDPLAGGVEGRLHPEDRGLGVERVEDRLDHQQVRAALDQSARRFGVGLGQLVEGHVAGARIGDVRRDRGGPVGRPEGAHHEARARRVGGLGCVGGGPRQSRALAVDLGHHRLEAVVGLGDPGGRERVGLDDVRPGVEVGAVDRGHDVRPGQADQVGVTAQVTRVVAEPLAPEVRLGQLV